MLEAVDLYCERTSPDFWAEPVNALTSAFFLLGAWYGWRRAGAIGAGSPGVWLLLALVCAIAVGSLLLHTFATKWSIWADVLPILIYQLVYLWLYCREIVGIRVTITVGFVLAYFLAAIYSRQFPDILNGSLMYAPATVVLLVLGIYHFTTRRIERYVLLGATGVFVFSLASRTLDHAVCPYFPLGSHFMWHACNALVLYLLLRGLLANQVQGTGSHFR